MNNPLTRKDQQDLICRVTGDAPLGRMFRRYWWPAVLAEEVSEPDGAPVRVKILGERLVVFRDSSGKLGALAEACPHRLASMALGRNEEGGLRCIYHGWKFGVDGTCLDMPTEPEGYNFRERLRTRAYPVREAGGIVWTYLGPAELEPAFPAYEWTRRPRNQVAIVKFLEHANYLQAAEGAIDSAHTRFLHRGTISGNEEVVRNRLTLDLAPQLECADTCYGFRYVAIRKPNENPDRFKTVKMTRYVFPTTAITSRPITRDNPALSQIFVPVDDEHTMHYSIWQSLVDQPLDEKQRRERYGMVPGVDLDRNWTPLRNAEKWYEQDREAMKRGDWTGIRGLHMQDVACQETMGPITDHSRERLGTSDVAIIRLRKRMLDSVRRFMAGEAPVGLDVPFDYGNLTHIEQIPIPIEDRWQDIQTFAGEYVEREPVGAR